MKTYNLEKTPTHTFLFEGNPYNPRKKACVGVFKNSPDLEKRLEAAKKRLQDHGLTQED